MAACVKCGEQNPPSANFCLACGAPLAHAAPAPPSARKVVTVLFCDVAGSTRLGEQLDPESLRRVMSRWFEAMSGVLRRHGGAVEKFIGDAVMAVFGVPRLNEDDALRAVRAAVEMRQVLARLNEELERDWSVTIQIRTGINTGEVVAGDPSAGHTFVTGDAVNVAKRLEQAARPSEILLGDATRRLVANAAVVEPRDPLTVKGKTAAVEAWSLLAVIEGAAGVARRLDAPLVGREVELETLKAAFDVAVDERACRIVTVLGNAGIGKSRLAAELRGRVAPEAQVLQGRCLPYGDGITFWPLVQVVDGLGGAGRLETVLSAEPDAPLVARHVRSALGAAEVAAGGGEVSWAVRRLLESVARRRPLVVVLEDIHWAEPTFLDLLEYLAGWTRDAPILLLCLARPELLDDRPGWLTGPNVSGFVLGPLTDDESKQLLDELAQEWPLDQAARMRIAEGAEGNPLYVEQMAAMLAEQGADVAETIPPSIHALLAARLDRLPPEERTVLERAAVAGKEFARSAVAALSPESERHSVHARLLSLVRKDLLAASPTSPEDAYRFRHALIRDAAYAGIPKELRAEQHEAFADWAAGTTAGRTGALDEIVGYHLEQGYRYRVVLGGTDVRTRSLGERAGHLLARAGHRAFARDDMPAAARLLKRASELVDLPQSSRREWSSALWSTGETAEADALLDEAIAGARASGDRGTEWLATLERAARRSVRDPDAALDELEAVAGEAARVFEELGDDAGLALALRTTSSTNRIRCRFAIARQASERALTHARRAGAHQEETWLTDELCTALLYGPTPANEAIARCEELLAAARGRRLFEANVLISLAGLYGIAGQLERGRALAAQARSTYEELGLRFALAGLTQVSAPLSLLAGDASGAERELREGLEIFAGLGARGLQAAHLAHVLAAPGHTDEARMLVEEARRLSGASDTATQVLWRTASARLLVLDGAFDEAVAVARDAVGIAAATDGLAMHAEAELVHSDALTASGAGAPAIAAAQCALALYRKKGHVPGAAAAERRAGALISAR
ncbi:MAG: zinc-ribbon domain-containing protein [Actinobacteria bacterium]|nr:MAG: zinc-ribbon domain-containing protein [Actinomycetota bacterium]